jgi:hypothetical protein
MSLQCHRASRGIVLHLHGTGYKVTMVRTHLGNMAFYMRAISVARPVAKTIIAVVPAADFELFKVVLHLDSRLMDAMFSGARKLVTIRTCWGRSITVSM